MISLTHWPASWKVATVVPIPKPNKPHTNPTNYRPISLLNTMSKLAEKIILKRILKFNNKNKIIKPHQFGFRPKHNTIQQIVRIITDTTAEFNKNKVTAMVLLDLEKAFDKIWIKGLTHKLQSQGFPQLIVKIIHSYLSDRSFKVKVNNSYSTTTPIPAGVPQGSVLGPVLFSLYLNDLPTCAKTNTALFADDTAIYAHSFNADVASKQIQLQIYQLEKYWKFWKIKINSKKTEQIIFSRKFTNNKIFTPLKVENHKIKPKDTVKYLGMILDNRLTHRQHIKPAYAPAWCNAALSSKIPIQRIQNKCLRFITNLDRYTTIKQLHDQTNIKYLHDYTVQLSDKFYNTQIEVNPLLSTSINTRLNNNFKHKIPFQVLPSFN